MFKLGYGPRSAKIVIVGECYGMNEERTGIPFSGPSGYLLNEMLSKVGISRPECYVTNVINMRPPKNDFNFFYLDKSKKKPNSLLIQAIDFLREDIKQIRPNLIITLGAEALKAITGKKSIEKWRGTVISTDLGKVLPTYHPAFILRMYKKRSIAELDLRKASKESFTKEFKVRKYNLKVGPSFEEVLNFLDTKQELYSFDIETTLKYTRCLGFAWSPFDAFCIPFMESGKNYWSEIEELLILKRLDILFKDKDIGKIAQNFPFDSTVLCDNFGFDIQGLVMDTMIAHHCCYSEMPKGLDFLTSIYTDIGYYAEYNVYSDYSTWTYNLYDCIATFQVALELEKEMKELGVFDLYTNHVQPLMLSLAKAGNRGVLIDTKIRDEMKIELELDLNKIELELESYV